MANPEHVAIVQQGAEAIARWRKQHPGERLDLKRANLSGANLFTADLSRADLSGANLALANLNGADLSGADLSGANLALANLNGANLSKARLIWANLNGANLGLANLALATLNGANLSGARLFRANLFRADLRDAELRGANLSEARLIRADLIRADLSAARLSGANLSKARLIWANLSWADLSGADLSGAAGLAIIFAQNDLSTVKGLESVQHIGPNSIGIDTLIASFRGAGNRLTPELEAFFLGAGVPSELLAQLPRILAGVPYCPTFVCYGEPDRAFAEKLVNDLRGKGVSCWIYTMDAIPGERTWSEIGQKRREADKMVVLCSAPALIRDGVLKEIEEQIDEGPDKMLPISLDNLWKETGFRVIRGNRDLRPFLTERNYADFGEPARYGESLRRLLKGLERKREAGA